MQTLETSESSDDEEEGAMMDGTNGSTGEPDSEFEPELEHESSEAGSGGESDTPSEYRDFPPAAATPARDALQALSGSRVHPPLPMGRPVPAVRKLSAATAAAQTLRPGAGLNPMPVVQRRGAAISTDEQRVFIEGVPPSGIPPPPLEGPICATIGRAKRQWDCDVGAQDGIDPEIGTTAQGLKGDAAAASPADSVEARAKRQRLEGSNEAARQLPQMLSQISTRGARAQAGIQQVCI